MPHGRTEGGGERDTGSAEYLVELARSALAQGRQALAAGDAASALRWLERAHRLVPADPNATLTLASTCLTADLQRAVALFRGVAERHDVSQAWLGLATGLLRNGDHPAAIDALAHALSYHALTAEIAALADVIAIAPGWCAPGWCALTSDGRLEVRGAGAARIVVDGRSRRGTKLPPTWQTARRIEVTIDGAPALGSPIRIDAIRAIAGCVEPRDGGIIGWAWHPHDPATNPRLTLLDATGRTIRAWQADDETISVPDTGALARPRGIRIPPDWLNRHGGPFRLLGPNGRDLPGSPLDPRADQAAHISAAQAIAADHPASPRPPAAPAAAAVLRINAPPPPQPLGADNRRRDPTIVIPVHNGGAVVQDCLDRVLDTVPAEARILVIDDGSSDPAIIDLLDSLARRNAIALLRHPTPRGFPAAANSAILLAKGRDIVLLNSDTLPPPKWLERLRAAAYAAPDIGTVTPISNEASILSYPGPAGANPMPDHHGFTRLDRIASRVNGDTVIDIPVGIGFCLYIRRDCLNATGLFRAGLFAQGYGEETDFCLRARHLGWRHVALPGLFVGHLSGQSFGSSATHLRARNSRIIEQLHPGYSALIDRVLADDPLAEARRRIDSAIWRQRAHARQAAAILITHNDGGGVEQRVLQSARAHHAAGRRPVILRPAQTAAGAPAISICDGIEDDLPNLLFRMPDELPALRHFLRACNPETQEVHHLLGYHAAIYDLIRKTGVSSVVHIHDYAWFCPRVTLVDGHGRYCGEPDIAGCEACVADHGHHLHEDIPVATLRQRSADILHAADRIVTPSDDTGSRMRRHFPGLPTETIPHADDTIASATPAAAARPRSRPLVCVVGGIGVHKGYDVLLACARDARRRDLDLGYAVIGYTLDDQRIMATGRVFVTGLYQPHEAVGLITERQADLGFIPSVCPETWCLSLDDIWRAGLTAVAFDIGAPAERIRRTGRGFLLPLGLSISAINNSLIAAIRAARH